MKALIVGYGSIGKRHAHVLKTIGCEVFLVTSQNVDEFATYKTLEAALKKELIDYVVIANATSAHYKTIIQLIDADFRGLVLVEKPLYAICDTLPEHHFKNISVAYNIRFHELFAHIKKILAHEKLVTFSAYVGQYLPGWRKNSDYRDCYSAKKEMGGGVLRDLSHELDYCLWLCGSYEQVTAVGGHFSPLEIDSDDVYSILIKCIRCPVVSLHINYLDRTPKRKIIINTHENTYAIDFMRGTLHKNDTLIIQVTNEMAATYENQHKAILNNDFSVACSYKEGLSVVKLIEAIEQAATSNTWVAA